MNKNTYSSKISRMILAAYLISSSEIVKGGLSLTAVFENKKKKVMMPISNPLCTTFWHEEVIRANV